MNTRYILETRCVYCDYIVRSAAAGCCWRCGELVGVLRVAKHADELLAQ